MKSRYDVVIVGGGPAGLSAALLLGRCLRRVMICDAGNPRNGASRAIHGFLGHDGMSPGELLSRARQQLGTYETVAFTSGTVRQVDRGEEDFTVRLEDGSVLKSRALLLATGVRDTLPDIPAARKFYGVSLHHCPYCDGWEHRGQEIGVIGHDQPAADLALELQIWSPKISLYTHLAGPPAEKLRNQLTRHNIRIVTGEIAELMGKDSALSHVVVGLTSYPCEALFFPPAPKHQSELAQSLGCGVDGVTGAVTSGLEGKTGIEGLFAAGNLSEGIQMAVMAAAEGLTAAATINDWLLARDTQT